jgi:hypothetical protein
LDTDFLILSIMRFGTILNCTTTLLLMNFAEHVPP